MHKNILKISYIMAGLCSLLAVFFTTEIYDDIANYYAPMARAFSRGNFEHAFYANVPILNSTLAGILVKIFNINAFKALVIISTAFYIATIPVLYNILKLVLKEKKLAALGAFLFVISPVIIRFSTTGLLNSAKTFFLSVAILLIYSIYKKNLFYKSLLLGIVMALLALARVESCVYLPVLGIFYLIAVAKNYRQQVKVKDIVKSKLAAKYTLYLGLLIISFVAVITPQFISVYKQCGVPAFDGRQSEIFAKILKVDYKVAKDPFRENITVVGVKKEKTESIAMSSSVLGSFKSFARGSYFLYLIFAALGLIIYIKKKRLKFHEWLLLSVVLINWLVICTIMNSARYYSINGLLLMPFTITGLIAVIKRLITMDFIIKLWAKKAFKILVYCSLIALILVQFVNGMKKVFSKKQKGSYYTGMWINNTLNKPLRTSDDSEQSISLGTNCPALAFYSDVRKLLIFSQNNTAEFIKERLNQLSRYDYIAVENKKSDHILKILNNCHHFKAIKTNYPYNNKVTIYKRVK